MAKRLEALAGKRAVLIDDDAFTRDLIARMLRRLGIEEVEVYRDAIEALTALLRHAPDLILCDVMMHPMDGFEFLRRLRSDRDPAIATLPVILISGRADAATVTAAKANKADGYLVKPFDSEELSQRVLAALARETAD